MSALPIYYCSLTPQPHSAGGSTVPAAGAAGVIVNTDGSLFVAPDGTTNNFSLTLNLPYDASAASLKDQVVPLLRTGYSLGSDFDAKVVLVPDFR